MIPLEDKKADARKEAARLMGSIMTPAKYAAVKKAAQSAGRKKGTPQSEETKAKIRATRQAQEDQRRAERAVLGIVEEPKEKKKAGRPKTRPDVIAGEKRPVGRPKKQTGQETAQTAGTAETGA